MKLFFSNHLEGLYTALASTVAQNETSIEKKLIQKNIVVPNYATERLIQIEVMKRAGVAANLKFYSFHSWIQTLLDLNQSQEKILDQKGFETLCFRVLDKEGELDEPGLRPLKDYLFRKHQDETTVQERKLQLCKRLGSIFEKYGLYRPHLLQKWEKDQSSFEHGHLQKTEQWQKNLWIKMMQLASDQKEKTWMPVHAALKRLEKSIRTQPFCHIDQQPVHIFGFLHLPPIYMSFLSLLRQNNRTHVYAFNPSRQYWGDLRKKRGWEEQMEEKEEERPIENPLLRSWGNFTKQTVHTLIELNEGDFSDEYFEEKGQDENVLHCIQDDILDCCVPSPDKKNEKDAASYELSWRDEGIQISSASHMQKELERTAKEIWQHAEEGVFFNDLCVVVPENKLSEYYPILEAAFYRKGEIPHHWIDVAVVERNLLTQAASFLLDLMFGTLSHSKLNELLEFPQVYKRIGASSPGQLLRFLEPVGFKMGSHQDFFQDTYITEDILNINQGIKRIGLGAWMQESDVFELDRADQSTSGVKSYISHEPKESWAFQLGIYLRSLEKDIAYAKNAYGSLVEWSVFFSSMFTNYLEPVSSLDQMALRKCMDATKTLSSRPLANQKVRGQTAAYWLSKAIASARANVGEMYGEGVTVGTFRALQNMPMKYVWMLGLEEKNFPRTDSREMMDLTFHSRQSGDFDLSEHDTFGLLQTIAQTKYQTYLSFIDFDEESGEPINPSSLIFELQQTVEQHYPHFKEQVKIKSEETTWDDSLLTSKEYKSQNRANKISHHVEAKTAPTLIRKTTEPKVKTNMETSLLAINRFLECPLNGWAREILGLKSTFEGANENSDDEPLKPKPMERAAVLRKTFYTLLKEKKSPEQMYQHEINRLQAQAKWPLGLLADQQKEEDLSIIHQWKIQFEKLQDPTSKHLEFWSFGKTFTLQSPDKVFDPLQFKTQNVNHESSHLILHGQTAPLMHQGETFFLPQWKPQESGEKGRINRLRILLRLFLDHVMLSIQQNQNVLKKRYVHFAFPDEESTKTVEFETIDPDHARKWLGHLITELHTKSHAYYFPCEAVLRNAESFPLKDATKVQRDIGWVIENMGGGSSRFGSISVPWKYASPSLDEILDYSKERFGFLLESTEASF